MLHVRSMYASCWKKNVFSTQFAHFMPKPYPNCTICPHFILNNCTPGCKLRRRWEYVKRAAIHLNFTRIIFLEGFGKNWVFLGQPWRLLSKPNIKKHFRKVLWNHECPSCSLEFLKNVVICFLKKCLIKMTRNVFTTNCCSLMSYQNERNYQEVMKTLLYLIKLAYKQGDSETQYSVISKIRIKTVLRIERVQV